jgi:formate hydrogenlyase transcriptional activator
MSSRIVNGSGSEEKYRLLLEVSAAANAQLDFIGVLEATIEVLRPIVPVDTAGVITVEGEMARAHAIHVVGFVRKSGESFVDAAARGFNVELGKVPTSFPIAGSALAWIAEHRRAYAANDLQAERRFPEEERLIAVGVRAYVRAPLFVRERLIGAIILCRFTPTPFTPEEVSIIEDVARPVATAVANSIAYQEIRRLRDQLHAENLVLRQEIEHESMLEEIVGSSAALRTVLARVEKVAPTDSTVLITGETGTGKELVARAIHRHSARAARAFIKVNCAAIPAPLLASELFGHEKGAFTGAVQQRIGRFELANGGSILLDEVGELPAETQVALLRVIQEREFERVGGTRTLRTDVRLIAATNRDLHAAVASGAFRRDLLYRLNVFPIEVPPLRERKEDVAKLVEYFAARYGARLGKKLRNVDPGTMSRLIAYPWPGNVRELRNVLERAAILSEDGVLRIEEGDLASRSAESPPVPAAAGSLRSLRDHEKRIIESVLAESRGRISGPGGAAARLGMPATTLESKIKSHGIDKRRFQS